MKNFIAILLSCAVLSSCAFAAEPAAKPALPSAFKSALSDTRGEDLANMTPFDALIQVYGKAEPAEIKDIEGGFGGVVYGQFKKNDGHGLCLYGKTNTDLPPGGLFTSGAGAKAVFFHVYGETKCTYEEMEKIFAYNEHEGSLYPVERSGGAVEVAANTTTNVRYSVRKYGQYLVVKGIGMDNVAYYGYTYYKVTPPQKKP